MIAGQRLALARVASQLGPLFPLAPNSKVPTGGGHGCLDATRDDAWLKPWSMGPSNLGLHCVDVFVVDVDPRSGGDVELAALEREHGRLPDTPRQFTAGGGAHHVFAFPQLADGQTLRSKIAKGVDIKAGSGAYIVVSPSAIGGRDYRWDESPEHCELAPVPEWLLALATRKAAPFDGKPSGSVGDALLAHAFAHAGLVRFQIDEERLAVRCPWEHEHTTKSRHRDSSTIITGPRFGSDLGGFVCSHSHCEGRKSEEALAALPREAVEAGRRDHASRHHAQASENVSKPDHQPPPIRYKHTDAGNADRLIDQHKERLRYVAGRGWLAWDGRRWRDDDTEEVVRLARLSVRGLYQDAADCKDENVRKALAAHATKSESAGRIGGMVQLARSDARIIARPSDLDADPWALNVANGTIDLRTGQLQSHDPAKMHTKLAPVAYEPHARAPRFEAFVSSVCNGDAEEAAYLQRVIGYAITGDVSEQVLFFPVGDGANGKSTLFETLADVLGDYATSAVPSMLVAKDHESHPTERADLAGARLVTAVELNDGNRLDEALVKQLTGADRMKARRMHRDFFEFTPTHKLFVLSNHKPTIRGTDHAIWRRVKLIPFPCRFDGAGRDPHLRAKLRAELPGILRWAVDGCLAWQRDGLREPKCVTEATAEYRADQDVLGRFLAERCVTESDAAVSKAALHSGWTEWQRDNAEPEMSARALGLALVRRGFIEVRTARARHWKGLRLMTAAERVAAASWAA